MKKAPGVALAAALFVLSICGLVHGIRAGVAEMLYFQAKYGAEGHNAVRIFRLCARAHSLYPFNYNLCILAAETAYDSRPNVDPEEAAPRLALAERWCDAGLRLNFYNSQLRLLKTRLLAEHSLPDAIRYGEDYVDWEFWAPYNHAVLVDLYSRAGDFGKASRALKWVEGSEYYDEARRNLNEAWKREMQFTPAAPAR